MGCCSPITVQSAHLGSIMCMSSVGGAIDTLIGILAFESDFT